MIREFFRKDKWNVFFSGWTNNRIDNAYAKIIELYVEKSDTSIDNKQHLHKLESSIESWKYVVEFNRERQRLSRFPIAVIISSLLSGVVAALLTVYLTSH